MRHVLLFLLGAFTVVSCKPRHPEARPAPEQHESETATPAGSSLLAAEFPLLPMIEKSMWSQLLAAEARLATADSSGREDAAKEVARLTEKLRSRHPFKVDGKRMELGGIVYDRVQGRFSVPCRVDYPDPGDDRHPSELELLLCSEGGRRHETLFVSQARPLHLELLLHLTGHAKGSQEERFRIDVLTKNGTRIPVEALVRAKNGETLEAPFLWEFSGSDYKDLYAPDLSGDFAIFWHANDSVLRVDHEGIASGVVKLEAVPHPELKNGDPAILELVPIRK